MSDSKVIRLAGAAYRQALAGKWPSASRYVKRIDEECGGSGVYTALVAWCDTYVDHATDGAEMAVAPTIAMIRTDTGALDRVGSPNVPDKVQWAARLMRARAAMDHDQFQALIDELPTDDGYEIFARVMAVLQSVALTVNGLPRGFARMGSS